MIHTIHVQPETTPEELKKLFRKKLMTGGAVIRLAAEVDDRAIEKIFETFKEGAEPENIRWMVLTEIAKRPGLSGELREKLEAAGISAKSDLRR